MNPLPQKVFYLFKKQAADSSNIFDKEIPGLLY